MASLLKATGVLSVLLLGTFFAGGYLLPGKVSLTAWQTVVAPHDHMSALVATPQSWRLWSVWSPFVEHAARDEVGGQKTGAGATWFLANHDASIDIAITSFEPATRVTYEIEVMPLKVPMMAAADFYNRGRTTKVKWQVTADVGERITLRWLALIASKIAPQRYQESVKQLALHAKERAHQELQDSLAAEEAALIGNEAQPTD
jgi:hypothetical protein